VYDVDFTGPAEDALRRLDKPRSQRVLEKIKWLATNLPDVAPEALAGEWRDFYKLRVGDYRVIYTVDEPARRIVIHLVGHRRDVYRHPRG